MQKLRICFAGTPDFSAAHLSAILDSRHEIIAVYTQPDRPSGRGKKLRASPVKEMAQQHSIPVHQPISLRSDEQEEILRKLNPDLMVVVAYGLILPKPFFTDSTIWMPECACLVAAKMAGGCSDRTRPACWRYGVRCNYYADE